MKREGGVRRDRRLRVGVGGQSSFMTRRSGRDWGWRIGGLGILRGQASLVKTGVKSDILLAERWMDAVVVLVGDMRRVD